MLKKKQKSSTGGEDELKKINLDEIIKNLADKIIEQHGTHLDKLALIGVLTHGVFIAKRIKSIIEKNTKVEVPLGILDVTLYRDDISSLEIVRKHPVKETKIEFDITDRIIILVDDVLYTGRSVRAALDEIMDFGRPAKVELAVVIDRGGRELPIHANYVGKVIPLLEPGKAIRVYMKEIDGRDEVKILTLKDTAATSSSRKT
jgi:pyrimidine operon attenuation protein/uracil phosphoribosyltransferase